MPLATQRIRILSIDGAGLYGLTAAIWLRRLCEADERFLSGDDVQLFAGTSSGAINCMMLARHERPRDAVLSGELEKFWKQPGIFANTNPLSAFFSVFGVTGWFSSKDFISTLQATFGDLRLKDFKHQVFVSSFSWVGSEQQSISPTRQSARHWKPKYWSNPDLIDEPDREARAVDVAYAAAAPPVFRPIVSGFGDGAQFTPNPSVEAVAWMLNYLDLVAVVSPGGDGLV
ncbi:MAG TPA: patatin-like phospholipase family protein, partial [Myxococcaceae bacterium]